MSFLNTSVVSNASLVRQAQRHIHCLFMGLPNTLPHKEMMSICNQMEELERTDNLEVLFKFAQYLESFGLDQQVVAFEMSQVRF